MFRLSLYPIGDDHYLLVTAAALVLSALMIFGPSRARVSRGRRNTLIAIRAGVIALVIIAMLRPTLVYTTTIPQSATLVLLIDRTRSMSVPDEAGNRTRFETLIRALDSAKGPIKDLAGRFEVKAYTFDAELHSAELKDGQIALGAEPTGEQTAIGYALQTALANEAGKRLLAAILLSDGAQRVLPSGDAMTGRDVPPQTPAAQLRLRKDRLFTVRFGKSRGQGQSKDVALTDLLADPRVFVKNELVVTGEVRIDGYANREIPVRLLYETAPGEMEVVAIKNVRSNAEGRPVPVEFVYVPEIPGEHKLSVEVAAQPGELVTTNNRVSSFVNVLAGGLNVLYLEGSPREEAKFLRRSLDASEEINVDYVRLVHGEPRTGVSNLAQRLKPGIYEVFILGDLDSDAFQPGELEDLAQSVSRGAGLIMTGGYHSFGPGGYAETPLADVLPVVTNRLERQRFGDPIRKDLHLWTSIQMKPTRIGLDHFTLRLADQREENLAAWEQLPPLWGANKFNRTSGLKPLALVLAAGPGDEPLLIAQPHGAGRVMAFAGDSTWRWWMRGHQLEHGRFWRQVVLWLARKDESLQGNVWVKLNQRRIRPGQLVEFGVGIQSPSGETITQADATAHVVLPDGTTEDVRLTNSSGQITGSFRGTGLPGDYTIRVSVSQNGQSLGSARARFLVFAQDLELDNASADATALDSLATMTGGRSLAPEELPDLIDELARDAEKLVETTEPDTKSLWDYCWPFFLLLVGLLGAEWYLRKKWGLV